MRSSSKARRPNGKPYRIGVIDLPSFYAASPGKDAGEVKSASKDVQPHSEGTHGQRRGRRDPRHARQPRRLIAAKPSPWPACSSIKGPVVQVKDPSDGDQTP